MNINRILTFYRLYFSIVYCYVKKPLNQWLKRTMSISPISFHLSGAGGTWSSLLLWALNRQWKAKECPWGFLIYMPGDANITLILAVSFQVAPELLESVITGFQSRRITDNQAEVELPSPC